MQALLGRKIRMTQIFDDAGRMIPATAIEAGPCMVVQVKTSENDGYGAIQLGFGAVEKKDGLSQPEYGHCVTRWKTKPFKHLWEVHTDNPGEYQSGQVFSVDVFKEGDRVDVIGISKGKGFAGGMKRHNWKGGRDTHGSMWHRAIGSVGASSYPSRVFPGHTMPGHMGFERVTVHNLKVLKVDPEAGLLYVKGAIPGARSSLVFIRKTNRGLKARHK
jgi:large subunit ribosomal protein L3